MADQIPGSFVGGRWLTADDHIDVRNPADGSVLAEIGYGGKAEADQAADAAAAAFASWSSTTGRQRADILLETSRLLRERADEIGLRLARESGKRLPEAVAEVQFSAEYFRWFAEEVRRPSGHVLSNELPGRRQATLRRPAGVVAALTPWNFPVSIPARKLAPALAAGCTIVLRVSEKAPLAATDLIRCLVDSGLPDGVVNLVLGPAAEQTEMLLNHPAVRVVSFTGSTGVGRLVMSQASRRIVRPLLELGGDAAFVVFDDADIERAVEGAMVGKFRNNGQSCIAANRFFVHERVYDEFRDRFAAAVDAMAIGDPTGSPVPDLGPLIDHDRVAAVQAMVDEAENAGARRVTASVAVPEGGAYLAPALFEDVPAGVGLAEQEIFGPVAGLFRFRDEDEVLARANATEMGLAGYFYTRDLGRAWRMAERLEVGIVGCNNALPGSVFGPMGGVKQSGLGREGADVALGEFSDTRYVNWDV
jgi:succinate-semialdehyde dehydrogenase / glutarate-semialdehyde dehydrogenase